MAELEKLEYPKPLRDFIYSTFNEFSDKHPWVGQENIRPKSIAREMFESYLSFADYVRTYELQRAEGLLLRHINSAFKVLSKTVPDAFKTDTMRRWSCTCATCCARSTRACSRSGSACATRAGSRPRPASPCGRRGAEEPPDVTRDAKAFTAAIRTRAFAFLRAWSTARDEAALELLDAAVDGEGQPWTRTGCARRARPTAPSTAACGSTPRPATCATPT